MLNQLLNIKRLREQTLRTTLALHDEKLQTLLLRVQQLKDNQKTALGLWRQLTHLEGCMNHHDLNQLRTSLSEQENKVLRLAQDLDALENQRGSLIQLRAEQEALLYRNLREQEKLKLLEEIK